jgi:hypothetical protein
MRGEEVAEQLDVQRIVFDDQDPRQFASFSRFSSNLGCAAPDSK